MLGSRTQNHAAKCPRCGKPHRYTEIKFPVINDRGSWLVECNECEEPFVIDLRNPEESDVGECNVLERFDDEISPYDGEAPRANDVAVYKLDLNGDHPRFAYDLHPIYCCAKNSSGLERPAFDALSCAFEDISKQCGQALNNFLAGRFPEVEHLVVTVDVPCTCSESHVATFYCKFHVDPHKPISIEDMLLANVTGTDLADVLSAIHTKSFLMDALDKLIVRWRLFCDQVLIAAPFVGHQYKKKPERLAIWEKLLAQLDTRRTVFLTRAASFNEYKAALSDSGLDHTVLERFGLENQIVAAGTRKQDFHAKVYIGLGQRCEVLSGSANLVDGKSMENATFSVSTRARVEKRYLTPLKVTVPTAPPRALHHISVFFADDSWQWSVIDGSSPVVSG